MRCGNRCGEGHIYDLERRGGAWVVTRSIPTWVS
jgi:hypothetical protein